MEHTRLGKLPKTRKWRQVVDLIAAGADAAQVADAVIKVAEEAFPYRHVSEDGGFNEAVWLITQLALSAKSADPIQHLRDQGVEIHGQASLTGLIAALSDRMDGLGNGAASPSDLGELAHRALVDAVGSTLRPKIDGQLFAATPEVLTSAISDLRKPREFAQSSRNFFSRLTGECMH
jgi:hypothetical protein